MAPLIFVIFKESEANRLSLAAVNVNVFARERVFICITPLGESMSRRFRVLIHMSISPSDLNKTRAITRLNDSCTLSLNRRSISP